MRSGDRVGALRRLDGSGDPSVRNRWRNVLQPGDRRPRQGPSGARDRRARWGDGARRRQGRHSISRPEPPQRTGRPGPSRPGRPEALSAGDAGIGRADPESRPRRRRSGVHPFRGRRGHRRRACRRPHACLPSRRPHHRNLPSRSDPSRRPAHARRALRRPTLDRAGAESRRGRFRACPAQDRDAAPARRLDDRLGATRGPERRSGARVLLLAHHGGERAAASLPHHTHHR